MWNIIHFTCSVIAETECACEVWLLGYMHGGVGGTATKWCRARSSMMPFAHGLGSRLIAIRVFEASGWHCILGGIFTYSKAGCSGLDNLYLPSLFLGEWVQQDKAYSIMGRTYMQTLHACSSIFRGQPCMCLHRKPGPLVLLAFLFTLLTQGF